MPLRDYVTGRQNKIVIAGVGIGLIFSAVTTYSLYVRPAVQIEQPDGDVLFTLSDHGAIGVQSGSGVSFGSLSDCLKSGGSSGATMTFGTCGSGGGGSVNTGAILNAANDRFVNVSGDTMTGALAIRVTGGNANTLGLRIENTGSGRHLHAEQLLTTSGSLITEGTSYFTGNMSANALLSFVGYSASPQLTAADTTTGLHFDGPSILSFHNGGTQTMLLSSSNNVGIGTGSPRTKLEVIGTMSGRSLRVTGTGASALLTTDITTGRVGILTTAPKATLDVVGSISGSSLFIANLNAASCDVKSTNGVLSCGTDATGGGSFGSGNVITIGNQRYVSKQGDTMTGALTIQNGNTHTATATPLLNVRGTMSGRSLYISGTGGSALVMTNITTGRVGIGTSAPKAKLDVVGTISGSALTVSSFPATRIPFMGAGGSMTTSANMIWNGAQIDLNSTGNTGFRTYVNGGDGWYFYNGAGGTGNFGMYDIDAGKDRMTLLGDSSVQIGNQYGNPDIYIDTSRNVSIGKGVNTIKAKFDVGGTISGALITQNGAGSNYFMGSVGVGIASPQQPLHVAGETNGSAIGPLLITYAPNAGNANIGVGLTLDATATAGGKKFSFISTGNTASPSGGKFAVYNGSDNRYVFLVDDIGRYIAGINQYDRLGQITSYPNSATTKGLVVRGAASQTAFLQEWQNSAGTGLAVITATGALGLGTASPNARLVVSGATVISDRGNVVAARAAKATLDVIGTTSGSRLVVSGDSMMSGSLVVKGGITSRGTISGSTIYTANLQRPLEGCLQAYGQTTAVATGTGGSFDIPASATGSRLYTMRLSHKTSGNGTTSVKVERSRPNAAATAYTLTSMLSTNISTDSGELNSTTAATPYVVATTEAARVQGGDKITFNVTAVPGTPPNGLDICFTFLPK